jgi:hypothetical protein
MAKRPGSKKKGVKFGEAVKALRGVRADHQEFGRLHTDGTHRIDPAQLDKLKRKVGKGRWGRVRFVALNAPFKRRAPAPSA